ncbi:hypothetical protein DSM112329_02843 [Paraconexibacter sp. AEG42_29]|uniref:Uncharacterized protein n=2 Tax=Paraconexibacter sp. AEG42_29 TaxID=2997339 RepID=A0AAU7AXC4_9ACTN
MTHITRDSNAKAILGAGIRTSARGDGLAGVFAMPILPNYFVSHQWLRELKRHQPVPLVAIDFVVPDDEPVMAGHYSATLTATTAAQAAGVILAAEDPRGFEIVIPRKIAANEIKRTRPVNNVVGWRYWPQAHGRPPCTRPYCQAGTYGAAQLRSRD